MVAPDFTTQDTSSWSHTRTARLGFLVGLGWDARHVADDPLIASKPATVRSRVRRLGLAFRGAGGARLPYAVLSRYAEAAERRGLSRDELIHHVLLNAGSDDVLIDNILDD